MGQYEATRPTAVDGVGWNVILTLTGRGPKPPLGIEGGGEPTAQGACHRPAAGSGWGGAGRSWGLLCCQRRPALPRLCAGPQRQRPGCGGAATMAEGPHICTWLLGGSRSCERGSEPQVGGWAGGWVVHAAQWCRHYTRYRYTSRPRLAHCAARGSVGHMCPHPVPYVHVVNHFHTLFTIYILYIILLYYYRRCTAHTRISYRCRCTRVVYACGALQACKWCHESVVREQLRRR